MPTRIVTPAPYYESADEWQSAAMSIRSFTPPEFDDEADYEGGASIPDIPMRGSSRPEMVAELRARSPEYHRPQSRTQFNNDLEPRRRPINPNSLQIKVPTGPPPPDNLHDLMSPGDVLSAASRSPSLAPKSTFSRSSRSRPESSASSIAPPPSTLPALQTSAAYDHDGLEPLAEEEIDPASFDLVVPAHAMGRQYSLETQSEQLFSKQHLAVIFEDPVLLQRFTTFVCQARPKSVAVLAYYMDALKALKAIEYANAVTRSMKKIEGLEYTVDPINQTINDALREKANQAFETLTNHDLPAYITHTYIQTVSLTIKRRIADTLPAHLRDMSEGLAEVFCLTDPSRPDNPIVFASDEFHRTTQYGMSYVLGRNCRFLQGPKTNPYSVRRLREKLDAGLEHCETFLNYRRDGSPFMNLLMVAPLYDSRGTVRYHIGAQVDVSGLVKDCAGLESLARVMERENPEQTSHIRIHGEREKQQQQQQNQNQKNSDKEGGGDKKPKDEFRDLVEMFSLQELKTVRESGGSMHRVRQEDMHDTEGVSNWHKPRLLINDDAAITRRDSDPVLHTTAHSQAVGSTPTTTAATLAAARDAAGMYVPGPSSGKLSGIYEHYLLVRPYPSLRILFASPSLRVPGMLQSSLMGRIGGSTNTREALTQAFADGHGVTAKVRWLTRHDSTGRPRWIHCTPLQGSNGAVGVWMVVIVDDEADAAARAPPRDAPPVERFLQQHRRNNAEVANSDNMSLRSFQAAHGGGSINQGATQHREQQQQQQQQYGADGGGAQSARDGRTAPGTPDTWTFG